MSLLSQGDPPEDKVPVEGKRTKPPPPDPALQVLTLAQRTAEALVSAADRHADKTRADAQIAADRLSIEAKLHASRVRAEADDVLTAAHTTAEHIADQAMLRVEEIRRQAEEMLASARAQAGHIVSEGHVRAAQLKIGAQQEFEVAVGRLGRRRAALHEQIEALDTFDRECRKQLTTIFQRQLQALWAQRPPARDHAGRSATRRICRPRHDNKT